MKRSGFARKPGKPMKRSYMKAKPKQGRKQAIMDADDAINAATLSRCRGKCEFPGCNRRASTNHHVIHCRNYALRWRRRNNVGICAYHHDWEGQADHCVEFGQGEVEMVGGQAAYDALVLYGNTAPSEEPGEAIIRLKKCLDTANG